MELPIACTLTLDQLQDRRKAVLSPVRNAVVKKEPIAAGYRYEFDQSLQISQAINTMVELELRCCSFLRFQTSANDNTICLEVTGPAEALGIIEDLFG